MTSIHSMLLVVLTAIFMISCQGETKDAARESLASTNTTATPAATTPATPATDVPTGPTTSMNFPETEFDFGEIEEGEKV
ncbi:MAG: DUF1573 domain-containing protein, partial [Bacteroidota bacterium]